MELEDFMLGEMSQLKKDKYCIIPLLWTETDTESGMVAARAGEGDGHLLFNGDSLSLGTWEVLKTDGGDGCTTTWISLTSLKYTFKNG